jgi:hypothetical protein
MKSYLAMAFALPTEDTTATSKFNQTKSPYEFIDVRIPGVCLLIFKQKYSHVTTIVHIQQRMLLADNLRGMGYK